MQRLQLASVQREEWPLQSMQAFRVCNSSIGTMTISSERGYSPLGRWRSRYRLKRQ